MKYRIHRYIDLCLRPPRPPFEAPTSLLPFTYPSRERHPGKTETDRACKVQQTRQGYQRRLAEKSIASATLGWRPVWYHPLYIGAGDFVQIGFNERAQAVEIFFWGGGVKGEISEMRHVDQILSIELNIFVRDKSLSSRFLVVFVQSDCIWIL